MELKVSASVDERTLTIGTTTINLSNPDMKHINGLVDGTLSDESATAAVEHVIEDRVEPFLEEIFQTVSDSQVEQECAEAFRQHLFLAVHEPEP